MSRIMSGLVVFVVVLSSISITLLVRNYKRSKAAAHFNDTYDAALDKQLSNAMPIYTDPQTQDSNDLLTQKEHDQSRSVPNLNTTIVIEPLSYTALTAESSGYLNPYSAIRQGDNI